MATKKPQEKIDVTKLPVKAGVDAESTYLAAQSGQSDQQWMAETSDAWANRQAAAKENEVVKAKGEAVVNLADATGFVGETAGASMIVADASDTKTAVEPVKKKDEESDDKAGYLWGGLGLLGLVGVAAAAGGGGGGGGGSPASISYQNLVIDDPVANAFVFRDIHNDGHLHVTMAADGRYIVDPEQAVVITNDLGQFANLSGPGNIVSVGINRLPIMVHDGNDVTSMVASEGDRFFASEAKEQQDVSINDGKLAYIAGEDQVFDSIVISSGIELSVGGSNVTLATGVTSLVLAYLWNEDNNLNPDNESDMTTAIVAVAQLFGFELSAESTDAELMSFLLGGYDVAGIDSTGNLNQEIYSVINSLTFTAEAVNGESLTAEEHLAVFEIALNSILWAQQERVSGDLSSFALDPEILDQVIEAFFTIIEGSPFSNLVDYSDKHLFIDVARNHANFGGGAADIYESLDNDGFGEDNLVNMVQGGDQQWASDVSVVGDITVLAASGFSQDISLDLDGVELMSSNILVSTYGEDSNAYVGIWNASNATGTLMSNGTYTYDEDGETTTSIGDVTVQALGQSSDSHLDIYSSDITLSGNILVETAGDSTHAEFDVDWGGNSIDYNHVDVLVQAYGNDSYAFFEADNYASSGVINSVHVVAKEDGVNNQLFDYSYDIGSGSAQAETDITIDGTVGNITADSLGLYDDAIISIDAGVSSSEPRTHIYNIDEMVYAGWNNLTVGQKVELRVGLKLLTATVSAEDFNSDNELSIDSIINKLTQDSDYENLGIVIKQTTEYGNDNGIAIRWLEEGSSSATRLLIAGELVQIDENSTYGDDYTRSVIMDNNIIAANGLNVSADAVINIQDATGIIDEVHAHADGYDAGASVDIQLSGLLGDVQVTAEGGEDSDAGVQLNSTAGLLEYNTSIINVTALGLDTEAEYVQESYAIGDIQSISVNATGYSELSNSSDIDLYDMDAMRADVVIGGDITINSDINVYARNTQATTDHEIPGHAVTSRLSLGNLSEDYSFNSSIHMDDVAISVESYGSQAYAELADLSTWFTNDYEQQTVVTGNISELNVIASGYDANLTNYDPVVVANAFASVDLNLQGTIEAINITSDHVSGVNVWLSGDIDADGLLEIDVNNTNSSYVDLWMNDVVGDVALLETYTSENADTDVEMHLDGSIEEANFVTTTSGYLNANIEITGEGNFIENLTITTQGSSRYLDSTTQASVTISQESHGGVVNMVNGSGSVLFADTRLTYNSDYQADIININGLSPRQVHSNVFASLADQSVEHTISEFTVTYYVDSVSHTQTYLAGREVQIPGIGSFSMQSNGDYSCVSVDGWDGTLPTVTYLVDDAVEETLDLDVTNFDGTNDFFNLEINMTDVDDFGIYHQTALENNMTTLTGFTGAASLDLVDNTVNNFIQFGNIDDDDYTYQPGEAGTQVDSRFNISHYSDGQDGWMGGNTRFDDGDTRNMLDGYYDDFDTFFDAALYGIASEYAFIDLDGIEAANSGGNNAWDAFNTWVELNVTYREVDGTEQTILLDWNAGNGNFWDGSDGQLLNNVTVANIVSGLNNDIDWDGDEGEVDGNDDYVGNYYPWSGYDDNITLFDNGDGILGIRIGEGTITNVDFHTIRDRTDTGNSEELDILSTAQRGKDVGDPMSNNADFDSSTPNDVAFIEGGGYFFGMVLNAETLGTDNPTYRGVLAMDENGEGVTKLIELADVVSGDGVGFDNFSSAYIGEADQFEGMSLYDYNYNASNYDNIGNDPWLI